MISTIKFNIHPKDMSTNNQCQGKYVAKQKNLSRVMTYMLDCYTPNDVLLNLHNINLRFHNIDGEIKQ